MIPAKKKEIGNGVFIYGERQPEEGDKVWWLKTFNWANEVCRCYKHRSESGKPRRCRELGVIEITDPDTIEQRHRFGLDPLRKTFCPGCWHTCRKEVAVRHPDDLMEAR